MSDALLLLTLPMLGFLLGLFAASMLVMASRQDEDDIYPYPIARHVTGARLLDLAYQRLNRYRRYLCISSLLLSAMAGFELWRLLA